MLSIDQIRDRLAGHEPKLHEADGRNLAAVAVVLREAERVPELLFIERARVEGDPWSGHMAFPGGRHEPRDRGGRDAAARETLEEVGVSLAGADYLGRLDDLEGRHAGRPVGMIISAHVYHVVEPEPLAPNHEVAEAFWVPLETLVNPSSHVDYLPPYPGSSRYPGILVGDPDRHVVWGLTYRFLEVFLDVVGQPLPKRWSGPSRVSS
ncbi:MAG: CoA pyrophosphatase [Proteobacteria bacterium]|nr:CoA pyrophosphatase [Pseudomonadota bacterium]